MTLLYAAEEKVLPKPVERFLELAGVDPRKAEVSGVPEDGFLEGGWTIIGELHGDPWDGSAETAFEELIPGFKCWVERTTVAPPAGFEGHKVIQLGFQWTGTGVQELERKAAAV